MLEIVRFIHEHEDWETLLSNAPYNLKISWDDGFVLFKYNQINSDFNEPICLEARGLILDSLDNFKVVRMAFKKFFNLGESFADYINWDTAVASEKIDGSIMSVWYARHKWHLSTNGTIDAFKAPLNGVCPYKTFGELFESVLPLSTFVGNRYENICWTFELVSPYNKVVIDYPKTKVYLLSVRFMDTLKELDYDQISTYAAKLRVSYPQFYYMNDEAGFRHIVEQMPEGHEGIVVRDGNNNRVKIKTLLYFQMHRARNNGVLTLERAVELILANDHAEFLSYFPEYTNYFDSVAAVINGVTLVAQNWDAAHFASQWQQKFSEKVAKKQFAIEFAKTKAGGLQALAFKCYDGNGVKWLSTLTAAQWTRMFAHQFSLIKEVTL